MTEQINVTVQVLTVDESGRSEPAGLDELKVDDAVAFRVRLELDVCARVTSIADAIVHVLANIAPLHGGGEPRPLSMSVSRDQIAAIDSRKTRVN
jgi:hypothetical protein